METNVLKQQSKIFTQSTQRKLILANLVGTMLEIYDMSVYAYFAAVIAANFFPTDNKNLALLNTFAIFLVSFIVRPLGSVIFGHLGDTLGRKKTLIITILMISFATCGIGLLPNAHQIGIMAPILLTAFRIIQGLSFSGEYVGSLIFLLEQAPARQKAYMASYATCGGNIGLLAASLACWCATHFCTPQQLIEWGWRIPFLVAVFGSVICFYLRNQINEILPFAKVKQLKLPLLEIFQHQKKNMLILLSLTSFYMLICYLIYVWSITCLIQLSHLPMTKALAINSAALALQIALIPFVASLSDKIGRKPLLMIGIIGLVAAIYPYYLILQNGNLFWIFTAHLILTLIATFFTGILPVTIAELIPAAARYSGVGLGYNFAAMVVGGTTPLVAMLLLQTSQGPAFLSAYFIFWAVIAWVGALHIQKENVPNFDSEAAFSQTV